MRINDPELSDDPFSRNRRWMSCYCTGDDMMDREVTIGTAMLIDYGCKYKLLRRVSCCAADFYTADHCVSYVFSFTAHMASCAVICMGVIRVL